MTYTEAQKRANAKWRDNNIEKFKAVVRPIALAYYRNNKKYCDMKRMGRYYYKKECLIFRNILL